MSNANHSSAADPSLKGARVGLFATCLVDLFRPEAGFAAAELIESTGCSVHVPSQGCCGQVNFNSGDQAGAIDMARKVIAAFRDFDYVVVPSASCAAMLRIHYPELLADHEDGPAARELAPKVYELTQFLVDIAGVSSTGASFTGSVAMHHACSALRELGIRSQPEQLAREVQGVTLRELAYPEVCCGFGGLFCVKYPQVSERIAAKKIADIIGDAETSVLTSTDLGCLLHLDGKMHRDGADIRVLHIAELLTSGTDDN